MTDNFSLKITADLQNLGKVLDFVETTVTALGFDMDATYDVQLAVDEAVTNTILYGYRGQPGTITIDIDQEEDALVIRLRDDAPPFDPTSVPPPDLTQPLEERTIGGLGIYLMLQVMDKTSHRVTAGGGNELTLVKKSITKK